MARPGEMGAARLVHFERQRRRRVVFPAVEDARLQGAVHLPLVHRHRRGAKRADGVDGKLRRHDAQLLALQVRRGAHRAAFGHHVARARVEEGQMLEALVFHEPGDLFPNGAVEHGALVLLAAKEVRHHQHADLGDRLRERRRRDDDHLDVAALGALDRLGRAPELPVQKELDLDLAVGALFEAFFEELQRLRGRVLGREHARHAKRLRAATAFPSAGATGDEQKSECTEKPGPLFHAEAGRSGFTD